MTVVTTRRLQKCPVVATLKVLGNDWNMIAIRYLHDRPMKFNELKNEIGDISSKTLSRTLKHLALENIVNRKVLDTAPVSVQYSLTPRGKELSESLLNFRKWGEKWLLGGQAPPRTITT
jgi:DNA-binding HxlR family transcriptional regulator